MTYRKERSHARSLFLTADSLPTPLANSISNDVSSINQSSISSAIDEPRPVASSIKAGRLMTGEEKAKVRAAIANASTAEEVRRLEQQLREGWIPK
jgi:U2 small nuclear ribonucleoprotein A'